MVPVSIICVFSHLPFFPVDIPHNQFPCRFLDPREIQVMSVSNLRHRDTAVFTGKQSRYHNFTSSSCVRQAGHTHSMEERSSMIYLISRVRIPLLILSWQYLHWRHYINRWERVCSVGRRNALDASRRGGKKWLKSSRDKNAFEGETRSEEGEESLFILWDPGSGI